jgi:hypothetical protein
MLGKRKSEVLILSFLMGLSFYFPASLAETGSAITPAEIRNSNCRVPSMGEEPDSILKFSNGKSKSKKIPFAEMRTTEVGILNGAPAGVAYVVWNTGGSANWKTLVLFRRKKGKLVGDKNYSDYLSSLQKVKIGKDKILINLRDTDEVELRKNDKNWGGYESPGWISLRESDFR